jgi:hypothetical protein
MNQIELQSYYEVRIGSAVLLIHISEAHEMAMGKYRDAALVLDYIAKGRQPRDMKGRFIKIAELNQPK